MKKEYNIKDKVWIHIGERKLTEGRVVEIIDLDHLEEGHDPNCELYIIELKTGIDDIYEVRTYDQISPDAKGPINLFRKNKTRLEQRLMKRIGVILPNEDGVIPADGHVTTIEDYPEIGQVSDEDIEDDVHNPTPEEIHAAMDRVSELTKVPPLMKPGVKKRFNNNNARKKRPTKSPIHKLP